MKNKITRVSCTLGFIIILLITIVSLTHVASAATFGSTNDFFAAVGALFGDGQGSPVPLDGATSPYVMHNWTFFTIGKTIYLSDTAANNLAELQEFANGIKTEDWSISYDQKGNNRRQCQPPVLNITFKSGIMHNKFHGVSTYANYPTLKYNKIRLIPECDTWNDYQGSGGGDNAGFGGQVTANLREYSIFKIFRAFGVPTMDIVGFANITFITPDSGFAGNTFRYMLVARDDEAGDEIPFTTQFNLDPNNMWQSGNQTGTWTVDYNGNRLSSANIINRSDNTVIAHLSFDPDTTIRFLLLTDFLSLYDMGPLHNEDWALNTVTGKTEIIPHGFDVSYTCEFTAPANVSVSTYISALSPTQQDAYKLSYYTIARSIFEDSTSLDKMIALVNQFPYPDADKVQLIQYIKLHFYQFAKYYNSNDFALQMGQHYDPLTVSLPFTSDQDYQTQLNQFSSTCQYQASPAQNINATVVGTPSLVFDDTAKAAVFHLAVDVANNSDSIFLVKKNFAFHMQLVSNTYHIPANPETLGNIILPASSNIIDYAGPYYHINPHTTGHFILDTVFSDSAILHDTYYAELNDFTPSYHVLPISLYARTNSLTFGSMSSLTVQSPSGGETFKQGDQMTLKWTSLGYPNTSLVNIYLSNSVTDDPTFSSPQAIRFANTGTMPWTIGNNVPDGAYYIRIICADTKANCGNEADSKAFRIEKTYIAPTVTVIGTPTLTLSYDSSHNESTLNAYFAATLTTGNHDLYLPKAFAFSARAQNDSGDHVYYSSSEMYAKPSKAVDFDGNYYKLPANSSSLFRLNFTFYPATMKPDLYHASLDSIRVGNVTANDGNGGGGGPVCPPGFICAVPVGSIVENTLPVSSNKTNNLLVYGERGPFINSISPQSAPANMAVYINGYHFEPTGNSVDFISSDSINPVKYTFQLNSTNGGKQIIFIPSVIGLPPYKIGFYRVAVTSPRTGRSNPGLITVKDPSTDLFISTDKPTAYSGDVATLSLGIPSNAVKTFLQISCPSSVTVSIADDANNTNVCGLLQQFSNPLPSMVKIKVRNSSKLDQKIALGYSASSGDSNSANVGMQINITIKSIFSASLDNVLQKDATPVQPGQPAANPDQNPLNSPSPTPSPTISPRTTTSPSPTNSPIPTTTPKASSSPKPVSLDPVNFWAAIIAAFTGR